MTADRKKHWDAELVDCPSITVPKFITKLYGGETITLKSEASASAYHMIGPRHVLLQGNGYKLWTGETLSIDLKATFGMNNIIEIWALPSTAGDDITFVKMKCSNVEGIAEIEKLKKALLP